MSTAKHGVVLFSMGYTGFEPKEVPKGFLEEILTAFSQLKQKVIMRFDEDFIPFKPKNVMVAHWVPQQDILGKSFSNFLLSVLLTACLYPMLEIG